MVTAMAGMYNMGDLLDLLAREGGEELRLEPGKPPSMTMRGQQSIVDEALLTSDNVSELFQMLSSEERARELGRCGDVRFTYAAQGGGRFAVNATLQGEALSLRIRNLAL